MEFTSADYSQVELRYFADYCGGNLLQAFVDGKDLHDVTAEKLGVSRQLGKTINFGFLLYGGGPRKMAGLLGVSEDEARRKIAMLHEGFPEIEEFRRKVIDTVANRSPTPSCRTRAGRLRYIPELCPEQWERNDPAAYDQATRILRSKYGWMSDRRAANGIRRRGERLVVNYLVQGGARDLLVLGMNKLRKRINKVSYIYPSYSIVTTVHDEVLIQHPYNCGEEARELLKRCLEEAGPKLGLKVPIVAEPKTGRTWAEVK
jgi:DNA polymerase I-like protein with 3'-5' exonuclease and polymerase domains